MKRKFICAMLAAALLAGLLSGCSNDDSREPSETTNVAEPANTAEATEPPLSGPVVLSPEDEYISGTGTAVSNNGGLYVKYGGKIYFRLYDKNYYEPSVLGSLSSPTLDNPSSMMELGSDGNKEFLFPDDGFGEIYIHQTGDGALFILNRMGQGYNSAEEYDFEPEIYGISLDGTKRYDFDRGVIFAVDDERGLIIAIRTGDGICTIDTGSGEAIYLTAGDHMPLYYDAENGALYCADTQGSRWENPVLCVIDIDTGEDTMLFSLEKEAMDTLCGDLSVWYEYRNLCLVDDYLQVYLAGYDGYSEEPTGSALLQIGPDNFWAEIAAHPSDWFGVNKPFSTLTKNPFYYMEDYGLYFDHLAGIYMFDNYKQTRRLLSMAELSTLEVYNLEHYGEEGFELITNAEYVDENLFFTVMTGVRNRDEDADWGYGYNIEQCTVYHKDLLSGEITLLNTF